MIKPNLFLIGGPKTGSTSLHYYLSQHPQVFMTPDKEPHFFSFDFIKESDAFHGRQKHFRYRTIEEYEACYKEYKNEKIIGEASTTYLFSHVAAKEIHKYNPAAKIIVILREPVELLHSWYHYEHFRSHETAPGFLEAVDLETKRRADISLVPKNMTFPSCAYYSEIADHYSNLKRYFDLFDRKNIMVILYDEFKKDTKGYFRKILQFLEVESDFVPDFSMLNTYRKPKAGKLKYWMDHYITDRVRLGLFKYKGKFPVRMVGKIYYWLFTKASDKQNIDDRDLGKIRKSYTEVVKKTGELIGVDLITYWKYNQD